jgi:SAM-dependent methyltransferase
MDHWKFYAITHGDHLICNPLSEAKLDELIGLLDLPPGARVLDIASGKAELLLRLAERYGIVGDGVDLSPYYIEDAQQKLARRLPSASLTFHQQDGRDFAAPPASYDLASCIGASWTFDGHAGTLAALKRWTRPGGLVLVGEPFWRRTPEPEYLAASGNSVDAWATHAENVAIGTALGLTFLYTIVSSEDDWDRYEGLQCRAAERYAAAHPDDLDIPELLQRTRKSRDLQLRWGRDTVGWALYLFGVPAN